MWKCCTSLVLGLGLTAALARADALESAWRAKEMLGPDRWSEVVRIERTRSGLASASVVYALVFELEDRLWYYEEISGTQSLSLWRDHLAQDKADLGPLLREINPRFLHFERLAPRPPAPRFDFRTELPQGCFIECVAYLRALTEAGRAPEEARLVAYYAGAAEGTRGHTVLYFVRAGRRYCFDPGWRTDAKPVPDAVAAEPLAIACWSLPGAGLATPRRAIFFPLSLPPADPSSRIDRRLVAGGRDANAAVNPHL